MKKFLYYSLNWGLLLTLVFLHSAQTPKSEKVLPLESNPTTPLKEKKVIKDSLIKATNETLDKAIDFTAKINQEKDALLKVKEEEQVVIRNYISAVNLYLKEKGRTEKLVVKKNIKQQLKEGEIFLVKDSTCLDYRRRFLDYKKCTKWQFDWYLVDKDNNKEKLW